MSYGSLTGLRIVFRCDGSSGIGFGHVSRCLTLAQGFHERGATDLTFISRNIDQGVIASIRAEGYACHLLPADIDEAEDLAATQAVCATGRSLLITDSHEFSDLYYRRLHESDVPIVSVDDYAGVAYASDLVINHNITAAKFAYKVAPHTRLLLGTSYFPLREQFRRLAQRPKRVRERVESVVIALGGMPDPDAIGRVLDGLREWARECRARVTVVMGVQASAETVRQVKPHLPPLGQLLVNPMDLAALLWNSDLAIVNGSVTAYETAAIGTPLIMTAVSDNQIDAVAGFEEKGIAVTLPAAKDLVSEAVTAAVVKLAGDLNRRRNLAEAGRMLVDGGGTERIVGRAAFLAAGEPISVGKGEQ